MKTQNLFVRSDGTIQVVGDMPLELGDPVTHRASSIVPLHRGKRLAFMLLREIFGERGHIAAWTRTWHGPWIGLLFATNESYVHQSRWVVLKWEHQRLEKLMESN